MDSIAARVGPVPGKQARRSAEMRRRLCEAAIDVLCEVGYEALSTPMIAARAGVSRGAQTHHFATKADMIVAAFEHLLQRWDSARTEAFAGLDLREVPFETYLRFVWREIFSQPSYVAALELMLAARVDRELGERLRQLIAPPNGERDLRWHQLLRFADAEKEERFQYMTLCLLRGMAVHSSFNHGDPMNEAVLDTWIGLAKTLIAQERPG